MLCFGQDTSTNDDVVVKLMMMLHTLAPFPSPPNSDDVHYTYAHSFMQYIRTYAHASYIYRDVTILDT